jgi:hypothetical protein
MEETMNKLNSVKKVISVVTLISALSIIPFASYAMNQLEKEPRKIVNIATHKDGYIIIGFDGAVCGSSGYGPNVAAVSHNAEGVSQILSLATAAKLSGSSVYVWASDGGSYCDLEQLRMF